MSGCPYDALPDRAWWRTAVSAASYEDVTPLEVSAFRIRLRDRIATAGSCFAQEIANHLRVNGYNYMVTEPGPPPFSFNGTSSSARVARRQYGLFTARYGNIYTARQFRQLLERAYGQFIPVEDHWPSGHGRFIDPFRPFVEPEGFSSLEELRWDREAHFAAVRLMVESADVMVFTLGLTESWESVEGGAIYPICPGCGHGTFDPKRYRFHNFSVHEVIDDLNAAYALLKSRNPAVRLILTVSPVPLVATMSGRHVLTATTYSKSVLRVAADMVTNGKNDVCYFPSYEIIMGQHTRGAYFQNNLRTVCRSGVAHVMRCFFAMFADTTDRCEAVEGPASGADKTASQHPTVFEKVGKVLCDEELLHERYRATDC